LNSPLSLVDPTGLCYQDADGNYSDDDGEPCDISGGILNPGGGTSITVTDTAPLVDYRYDDFSDYGDNMNYLFSTTVYGLDTSNPGAPSRVGGTRGRQTFSQCMAGHANDFSIAGTLNHAFNVIAGGNSLAFQNNFFAQAALGNPITTLAYEMTCSSWYAMDEKLGSTFLSAEKKPV
jgi:hypothetical protein